MQLRKLCEFCDEYLKVDEFSDYCPNGLQVEANSQVEHIVCGVTASQALIEAAIEQSADTLIVHHGYFNWCFTFQLKCLMTGNLTSQSNCSDNRSAGIYRNGNNLIQMTPFMPQFRQ